MYKRCLITPELRPHVKGYKVNKLIPQDNCLTNTSKNEYLSAATILIISSKEDGTASYFENYIKDNDYPVETLFIEDVLAIGEFIRNLQISSNQDKYPSIYYRGGGSNCEKYNEVLDVMHDLLTFYPGTIVNRPSRLSLNLSKPLQMAAVAKKSDKNVKPIPTFLSNLHLHTLGFSSDKTIIKSASSIRSIVVNLSDRRLYKDMGDLACPVHLQPKIQGINIRAHVCGDAVYAMHINAEEDILDYRYETKLCMRKEELPQNIAAWCIQAARNEGLDFAGIDLIYEKTTNSYWFLEVNPTPGYHFFEQYLVDSGENAVISEWLLQTLIS
ncbi:hypothetical protein ACIQYG_24180 [Peribacillus sp. NPDC096622]|uniref:hypothetical protein n=1 Tax=Peribacillus sp. NPDC096622 TaxID=3364396 RepID=UPI00380B20EB